MRTRWNHKHLGPRDYHTYCGPAAVARILNVSRKTAADILLLIRRRVGRPERSGVTQYKELELALKFMGEIPPRRRWKKYDMSKPRPTLNQWLKANPKTRALVTASGHALYVDGGKIIEGNGRNCYKGRMQGVLKL